MIYVIGSLRQPRPCEVASVLRADGHEVFDDWHATHPQTDDEWRDYEKARGRTFAEALRAPAAMNVYRFDREWLDAADIGVLVLPAGNSGHLELGRLIGQGKPGFILLDGEPERWDVMYAFARGVYTEVDDLRAALRPYLLPKQRLNASFDVV